MSITFLCHFDGSDGSTTFVDDVGSTITAHGAAQLTTGNPLYGTACGLFNGLDTCFISLGSVTVNDNFTLDISVRPTAYNPNWSTLAVLRNSSDIISLYIDNVGSLYLNGYLMQANAVQLNSYTNLRVVRYSGELWVFKEGVFVNAMAFANGTRTATTVKFGSWGAGGDGLIGTIDELMLDDTALNTTHDSYTVTPFSLSNGSPEFEFSLENRRTEIFKTDFQLSNCLVYALDIQMTNRRTTLFSRDYVFRNVFIGAFDFALKNTMHWVFDFEINNKRTETLKKDYQLKNVLVDVMVFDFSLVNKRQNHDIAMFDFSLINVREQDYQSIVVDTHVPEQPIYGAYQ